ncbi:hypothetical protein BDZ91DRAFT_119941 [Kalaharituber pfeilii]|nr:hypothetical protein BDZ91DRAFT_119941 [Kalaharituber pfeilii]
MNRTFDDLNTTTTKPSNNNASKEPTPDASHPPPLAQPPLTTAVSSLPTLKETINNLPRTPQISRKVRACSACKKQKIRCDFESDTGATGDSKCQRCRKKKLDCVVNRSLQTILDEDVEWKMKMSEELAQLQRAVEDILRVKQMRPLSAYSTPAPSTSSLSPGMQVATLHAGSSSPGSSTQQTFGKDQVPTIVGPANSTTGQSPDRPTPAARMPMTRENSPEAAPEHNNDLQTSRTDGERRGAKGSRLQSYDHYGSLSSASLSTNPMGSLYEITRLRSLRSNSTTNVHVHAHPHVSMGSDSSEASGGGRHASGPSGLGRNMSLSVENHDDDLISRGLVSLEEAEELFELFRSTLNHYLFDVALVHDNLSSVRNSSSLLLASILTVASLHRPATTLTTSNTNSHTPTPSGTFALCYQHFLTLVSSSMFDFPGGYGPHLAQNGQSSYTRALDNVRALSIAAFWLPDLSWKLSGHAVRIATELNVHQSFRKALMTTPVGSKLSEAERMRREVERKFHYERARLWYLLYVCDHHFSIAYGRPPVICYSQHEAIRDEGYERYLMSDLCKEGDFRVVSQMALFVVLERIYECFAGEISEGGMVREEVLFGTDSADNSEDEEEEGVANGGSDCDQDPGHDKHTSDENTSVADALVSRGKKRKNYSSSRNNKKKKRKSKGGKVEEFNRDLDEWRDNWCVRLRKNAFVGDYPAKGVLLHYHFAKLQLNSLALRGVTASSTSQLSSADIISSFSPQRTAMARCAIESAKHVLTTILTVEEIRVCLIGVPLYVHTMIAFAAVFLMKVASRWRGVSNIADLVNPVNDIWDLAERVIETLRDVAGGGIRETGPKDGKGKNVKKGLTKEKEKEGPSLRGAGEMHIVWYIAGGLEKMVKKYRALVQKEDEEEQVAHHRRQGRWEDVWQESKSGQAQDGTATSRERLESIDAPVPPGAGSIMHPVEPKHEEQDYSANWNPQPHGFDDGNHAQNRHYTSGPAQHPVPAPHGGQPNLHPYSYTSTAPSDSHAMYAYHHHHPHHSHHPVQDDMAFGDPATSNGMYFTGLSTTYDFLPDSSGNPTGVTNLINGGGSFYTSFGDFDLFGGGTMEALPGPAAIPHPRPDVMPPTTGGYVPYLHPTAGTPAGHHPH